MDDLTKVVRDLLAEDPHAPVLHAHSGLNGDMSRRDRIIFGDEPPPYSGGLAYYAGLDFARLQQLVTAGFVDIDTTQNDSPSIGQFGEFMGAHPWARAHGYVVHPDRDDYRVSVEGLEGVAPNADEALEFTLWNTGADDLDAEKCPDGTYPCRSWWD